MGTFAWRYYTLAPMKLLQALRNSVQRIEADLGDSSLFDHLGDRGEFRERLLERFLRPFLPACYGLGSGAVFAADGAHSKQIDIVIYDAVFSNVLFRDGNNSLYPCENVFGTIEVKSLLDTAQLEVALENIASVKSLPRSSSDMCDILPFRRLGAGAGLTYDKTQRNPYLGLVFAYDGLLPGKAIAEINRRVATGEVELSKLPDFVFNYKRGYMVYKARQQGSHLVPAPPGSKFDCLTYVEIGKDTLPLFFLTTNICLNRIILNGPDLNAYWKQVVNDAAAAAQKESSGPE